MLCANSCEYMRMMMIVDARSSQHFISGVPKILYHNRTYTHSFVDCRCYHQRERQKQEIAKAILLAWMDSTIWTEISIYILWLHNEMYAISLRSKLYGSSSHGNNLHKWKRSARKHHPNGSQLLAAATHCVWLYINDMKVCVRICNIFPSTQARPDLAAALSNHIHHFAKWCADFPQYICHTM